MTTPDVLSLKQAGDSVTMHVMKCAPLGMGKYPEIEFTGTDGKNLVAVRMPKSSADRQLARIALTYETAVGMDLTISRDPNQVDPAKPFWGIGLGYVAQDGKTPAAAPTTEPAVTKEPEADASHAKLAALFKLHGICFAHALKLAAAGEKAGVPATLEGVSALTAQMLIAANQQGIR